MLLARMLGRSNLRHLHWGTSLQGFSFRHLTRDCYAWCPECLQTDLIPYDRMLWETNQALACNVHQKRLATTCNRCKRAEPRFGNRDVVRCLHCGCDYRTGCLPERGTDDEINVSEKLGQLISRVTSGDARARCSSSDCVATLRALARSNGAQSLYKQALFLNMSPCAFQTWARGKHAPSLPFVIYISLKLGIPLHEMWHRELLASPLQEPPINVPRKHWTGRLKAEHKTDILGQLTTLAERVPPISPYKAAAQIGFPSKTLKRLAPTVWLGMIARHKANKERLRAAKREWVFAKVDRYVNDCLAEGRRPTWVGAIGLFRRKGRLRDAAYHAYVQKALRCTAEMLLAKRGPVDVGPCESHHFPPRESAAADGVGVARRCHNHADSSTPAGLPGHQ